MSDGRIKPESRRQATAATSALRLPVDAARALTRQDSGGASDWFMETILPREIPEVTGHKSLRSLIL